MRSLSAIAELESKVLSELSESKENVSFIVYILRTSSNTLYVGQTNNLQRRMRDHTAKTSRSAKYLKYFKSFELVYREDHATRVEAMNRELQIKKWKRAKKEALIAGDLKLLKRL